MTDVLPDRRSEPRESTDRRRHARDVFVEFREVHKAYGVKQVLRGADPGTIPFELPDKTQFAFNRATARTIGVRVPEDVLMRATEVFG